jgi:hypothetical protein
MQGGLRFFAAAAAAGAIVVAGCGGGEAGTTAAITPAMAKRRFQHEAHRICYRLSKKQSRQVEAFYERQGWDPRSVNERQMELMNAAVILPIVGEKLEQLRGLSPPRGDEGELKRILAAMEKSIRRSEAHPQWLVDQTPTRPSIFTEVEKLTTAAGIWFCGEP